MTITVLHIALSSRRTNKQLHNESLSKTNRGGTTRFQRWYSMHFVTVDRRVCISNVNSKAIKCEVLLAVSYTQFDGSRGIRGVGFVDKRNVGKV